MFISGSIRLFSGQISGNGGDDLRATGMGLIGMPQQSGEVDAQQMTGMGEIDVPEVSFIFVQCVQRVESSQGSEIVQQDRGVKRLPDGERRFAAKLTSSGSHRYLQLVEAYRDEHGKPKQRTIATLGRLDQLDGQLDQVIAGLAPATGRLVAADAPVIAFESARAFGDVWALTALWHELGFDQLLCIFRRTRHEMDVEALLRILVFHRLCDPESKLGVLRWLETVTLPGLALKSVSHH